MKLAHTTKLTISREAAAQAVAQVSGYAAVYHDAKDPGTEYQIGPYRERIQRGAFDEVVRGDDDVVALFNHDHNWPLARRSAGTLALKTDARGLHFSFQAPMDSLAATVADFIRDGSVQGASITAQIDRDDIQDEVQDDDTIVRTISRFSRLIDVGPVTLPAFTSTDVQARNALAAAADRSGALLVEMAIAEMTIGLIH